MFQRPNHIIMNICIKNSEKLFKYPAQFSTFKVSYNKKCLLAAVQWEKGIFKKSLNFFSSKIL